MPLTDVDYEAPADDPVEIPPPEPAPEPVNEESPAPQPATEQAVSPPQINIEQPAQAPVPPERATIRRELESRLDVVRQRVRAPEPDDELEGLLDHAITLLDSLSRHPALRDHGANQRKLEEIEQRLGYGAYPQ